MDKTFEEGIFGTVKNPVKAIKYWLDHNCSTNNIKEWLNEFFNTDLTMGEVVEAINNVQLTYSKERNWNG